MSRQDEIAGAMAALRASGTATADRLPAAWQRAKDWHEYVRAYPLQAAAAAALVGFAVVPKRRQKAAEPTTGFRQESQANREVDRKYAEPKSRGLMWGLAAPLMPWVTSLATQAIHRLVMNQFNQFSTRIFSDGSQTDNADASSDSRRTGANQSSSRDSRSSGANGSNSRRRRADF